MNTDFFEKLSLCKPILSALSQVGYQEPTPIQRAAIPLALAGKDLLATAQTGTGKTAGFALPMLHLLHKRAAASGKGLRALILTPTRELALQIDESLKEYGRNLSLRTAVVLGGVPAGPQIRALQRKPDILVATPGRLLDLMGQGHLRLNQIEILVLDEADRMLDMGFAPDVRRIVAEVPKDRQTMLFSATMSPAIAQLASNMLRNPSRVEVTPAASVSSNIEQQVLFVNQKDKRDLLTSILKNRGIQRALVFTRTKHGADRVVRHLSSRGISADAIHSNKSQNARQRALATFDRGKTQVLVATDIVSRGIDVDGISHVINYEMPGDPESYVHRIGRTARAGAAGIAMSFCDAQEVSLLRGIEKLTNSPLTAFNDHPYHCDVTASLRTRGPAPRNSGRPVRSQKRRAFRPKHPMAKRGRVA